jgi:hypothetical protein
MRVLQTLALPLGDVAVAALAAIVTKPTAWRKIILRALR